MLVRDINTQDTVKRFAFLFIFFIAFFFHYYLRLFPFFLAINAFGTTYLGWHVRLFLKQTSIQSLHLVASKVWIKLIKIKVYICPPYFTHKIKTLFWTPSKTGVLKYLTFVSQINVMTQKVKLKNCTKMIKFILKIVLWSNDALCVVLLTISLIKKDASLLLLLDEIQIHWMPDMRDQWEVGIRMHHRT